jgi:hypothetical protein
MINTKLQSIIDTKSAIGNAIVNKGGTITGETPFFNYAAQIDGLATGATIDGYDESAFFLLKQATNAYGGQVREIGVNNGYVYVVGETNRTIKRYYENNLVFLDNSSSYGADIRAIAINNGFVYIAGNTASGVNRGISKFFESNLTLSSNSANFGGVINAIAINNGFIFATGNTSATIKKYYESNLVLAAESPVITAVRDIAINNGYVYTGANDVKRYHEGNLVLDINSANYGGILQSVEIHNGYVYLGGATSIDIKRYYESNLTYLDNTISIGGVLVLGIKGVNNSIYGVGSNGIFKFYESNLSLIKTDIYPTNAGLAFNNGFIYASYSQNTVKYNHNAGYTNISNTPYYLVPKE